MIFQLNELKKKNGFAKENKNKNRIKSKTALNSKWNRNGYGRDERVLITNYVQFISCFLFFFFGLNRKQLSSICIRLRFNNRLELHFDVDIFYTFASKLWLYSTILCQFINKLYVRCIHMILPFFQQASQSNCIISQKLQSKSSSKFRIQNTKGDYDKLC